MSDVTVTYESKYGTVVTEKGKAAIAKAIAEDRKLPAAYIAFGDGNGDEYFPDESQTDLKNELYVAELTRGGVDPLNPSCIMVEAVIPADVGGWDIREAALRLENGETVAVASLPTHPIHVISGPVVFDTAYRMIFQVSNAEVFEFVLNQDIEVIKEYVDLTLKEHNEDPEAHGDLIKETITKTITQTQTVYDVTMTRTDGHLALTVDNFPDNPPPLITLRGISTADYYAADSPQPLSPRK